MKIFTSLEEAQCCDGIVHIHRVSDNEWHGYEPYDGVTSETDLQPQGADAPQQGVGEPT